VSRLRSTCSPGARAPAEGDSPNMEEPLDTKVAVVLLEELPVWQKANVAAFLVSGIAGSAPRLVGEAYVDGSGNRYLPMLRQPILIYAADSSGIRRAYERAMAREVEELSIFTRELYSTPHDEADRAAVAAVPAAELDLVGIALRADRKIVDKVLDKLRPHS
jgi:hypothetical protein